MKKIIAICLLVLSTSLVFGQANGLVISNKASGGAIGTAAATVDVASLFNVNQTTAGQTLTVPNLTNTTNGKTIHINNVGSVPFTMLGKTVETGTGIILRWTGSAWSISGVGNASGGGGSGDIDGVTAGIGLTGGGTTGTVTLNADTANVLATLNDLTVSNSNTQAALDLKAPLASPALTGNPTVPAQLASDSSTRAANTAFVKRAVGSISGVSVATSTEINTGTDNVKVTTPSGLAGSKYITTDGSKTYGVATNTGNTYSVTLTPAISSYVTGQSFKVLFSVTNTSAITINFNGLGAKNVLKANATVLASGDLIANTIYNLIYDGTNFQIDVGLIGVWYDWVPSFTGFSTNPTVTSARYTLNGKLLTFNLVCVTGTSNSATKTVSIPTGSSKGPQYFPGVICSNNNVITIGYGQIANNGSTITINKDASATSWSSSANTYFLLNYSMEIN